MGKTRHMNGFQTHGTLTLMIAAVTAACFAGCSVTQPTMKIGLALYPPEGAEVETTQSYQLVRWNVGDHQLALSPRGSLDDMLDIWLSIENRSEDALVFFPSQIQYAYCRPAVTKAGQVTYEPNGMICTPFAAVPTQMQAAARLADRERKRKEADNADEAAMAAAMIIFVFAFIVVLAAASSSGSSKGGSGRSVGHWHGRSFVPLHAFSRVASDAAYFGAYREAPAFISPEAFLGGNLNYAIAESVIAAGGRHAGHIFIPPYANASVLRLRIGVGANTTTLDFDYQARQEPRPPPPGRQGR